MSKKLFQLMAILVILSLVFPTSVFADTGSSIYGTVLRHSVAVEGVNIKLSGSAANAEATTDSNGNYQFQDMPDGDYTLEATLDGYTFVPDKPSFTMDAEHQIISKNFTATRLFTIGGTVKVGEDVLPGVTVSCDNGGDPYTAVTNDSGVYTIENVPENDEYDCSASLAGYDFGEAQAVDLTVSDATLDFSASTYTISGHVTVAGDGMSGVTVSCNDGKDLTTRKTDEEGYYEFTDMLGGKDYSLGAEIANYSFGIPKNVTLNDDKTVDFSGTADDFKISGHILLENGDPVEDVSVGWSGHMTNTDSDGYYEFTGLGHSTYLFYAELAGYTFDPKTNLVSVNSDIPEATQDFTAIPDTYSISGHITLDGDGLENVEVSYDDTHSTTTDSDGYYEFTDLVAGDYMVSANFDGYTFAPNDVTVTVGESNPTATQNFFATPLYDISGFVKVAGIGKSGVRVDCQSSTGSPGWAYTDETGAYKIEDLLPSAHYLCGAAQEGFYFPDQTVDLSTGDATANFDAVTYKISGHVTLDGVGLENVQVSYDETHTATTNGAGYYEFLDMAGDYTLDASLDGYSFDGPHSGTVIYEDATVDFTATADAPGTYSISGHVTLDGDGLENVEVSYDDTHSTTTDSDGYYEFTGLAAGDYTLTLALDGYSFTGDTAAKVGPDATLDFTATADTPDTYKISGHVTLDGDGLENVEVSYDDTHSTTTDTDGYYEFTGLAAGDYTLTLALDGYTFDGETDATLGPDATLDFTATAEAPGTHSISGNVKVGDAGLEFVTVSYAKVGDSSISGNAVSDGDGYYEITDLGAGSYTLTAAAAGWKFNTPLTVTITNADQTQDITATLDLVKVSGTVKIGGSAIKGVTISPSANGFASMPSAKTDSHGAYHLSVPRNVAVTLAATHPYYEFEDIESLNGYAADTTNVNWTVASVTITGKIIDNTKYPGVRGLQGFLHGVDKAIVKANGFTAKTDKDGAYELLVKSNSADKNNKLATIHVYVELPGFSITPSLRHAGVSYGKTAKIFGAVRHAHTVSGKVTTTVLGVTTPVAGVTVYASPFKAAVTNSKGVYTLTNVLFDMPVSLDPWKYATTFSGVPAEFNMPDSNSTGNDFTATALSTPGEVNGHITLAGGSTPLPGVKVTLTYADGLRGTTFTAITDAAGAYKFTKLYETGDYTLTVSKGVNYMFTPSGAQTVAFTNDKDTIDFSAMRVAPIYGTITGLAAGTEVTFTLVAADTSSATLHATVDARHHYTLPNIKVGFFLLTPSVTGKTFKPATLGIRILSTTPSVTANFTAK